jgi:hypothetical protein
MVECVYVLAWTVPGERSYRKLSLPPAVQGRYLLPTYLIFTTGYLTFYEKMI